MRIKVLRVAEAERAAAAESPGREAISPPSRSASDWNRDSSHSSSLPHSASSIASSSDKTKLDGCGATGSMNLESSLAGPPFMVASYFHAGRVSLTRY